MYRQNVEDILQREVSREEFIKYIAITFLSLIGISAFIKNLHHTIPAAKPKVTKHPVGYGNSPYGR